MKKVLRIIALTIMSVITIAFLYTLGYRTVFTILNNRAVKQGREIDFNSAGQGITWIREGYDQTLFFIPSTEESAAEQLYGSWLKELHDKQMVNIIVPPFDADTLAPSLLSPVPDPEKRKRDIAYLLEMYSKAFGKQHKITVLSTGNGSLPALEIASRDIDVDKIILLSPLHGSRSMSGGSFFMKMAAVPFVSYLMPWLPENYGKRRVGPVDILNDELNTFFEGSKGLYYPDFRNTLSDAAFAQSAARNAELLDKVKPNRFFIIYGDDDLSYSLEGFERMGDSLEASNCEVSIMRLSGSGRMVLFDNGFERVRDLIAILLQ